MVKTIVMGSLLGVWFAMATTGCEIHSCEEGAVCSDTGHGDAPDFDERELCIQYCARVSVCGGPQADDIDECIDACEDRFDFLPEETRELCECAPRSSCEDVNDGRCSDPGAGGSGGRGGSSAGGSANHGGTTSTGGSSTQGGSSSGGSSAGGAPSTGGASAGGAPSTGGSSSGGSASCTGGTSSGGTDAGGAGGDTGACDCDCDCASGERCVDGACTE
jgi:hypothetical protein